MAAYQVACVNEDKRPLAGVTVEAVSLNSWPAVSATATTGRAGVVQFTGLTGPHFFRPRVTRVSTTVGGRVYTGAVEVQVIALGEGMNVDYVVDPDGLGTHTTLAAAVAAAIATDADKTIWLCKSITESDIDIGGMDVNAIITIASHSQHTAIITANANEDIFKQDTNGGSSSGGLHFRNVGFSIPTADKAIYFVNCTSEIVSLSFDECWFSGQYLARQAGNTNLLTELVMRVANCTGSLAGFYDQTHTSQAAPDVLEAYDNDLVLTSWWDGGAGAATPDFFIISGGRYTVASALEIGSSMTDGVFSDLWIQTGVAASLFTTGANSINIDDLAFMNLIIRFTNASGSFGNFGSNAAGNNDSLVIMGVFGYRPGDATSAETFLTVDSDWLNPYVSDIHAPDWATLYSGPSGVGDDHGLLGGLGDDDHTQYALLAGRAGGQALIGGTGAGEDLILQSTSDGARGLVSVDGAAGFTVNTDTQIDTHLRVGGLAHPVNTADGDLTCVRLNVGDVAFPAGIEAYIGGDLQVTGQLELDGDLNHDGSNIGFFGTAPVAQAGAYTQTYATADKTHANPTATAPGDLVATDGGWGYSTEANADKVHDTLDKLVADMADIKQLVNAVIDDLQAYGLFQ